MGCFGMVRKSLLWYYFFFLKGESILVFHFLYSINIISNFHCNSKLNPATHNFVTIMLDNGTEPGLYIKSPLFNNWSDVFCEWYCTLSTMSCMNIFNLSFIHSNLLWLIITSPKRQSDIHWLQVHIHITF